MNQPLLLNLDLASHLAPLGKDWTCMGFVLDRSGSMGTMEKEARNGYNAFIEKQAQGPDLAALTTIQFDHELLITEVFEDVRRARRLDEVTYQPRGTTALLDAMGRTIEMLGQALDQLREEEKARRVIVVTLTDGLENASQDFKREQIEQIIKHQREVYSWEFIFLGAGLDSIDVATSYGIPATHAAVMHPGGQGMQQGMQSLNAAVGAYRMSGNQGVAGAQGPQGQMHYTSHLASNKMWGGSKPEDDEDKKA
jgi:uncharacterized protein YegL